MTIVFWGLLSDSTTFATTFSGICPSSFCFLVTHLFLFSMAGYLGSRSEHRLCSVWNRIYEFTTDTLVDFTVLHSYIGSLFGTRISLSCYPRLLSYVFFSFLFLFPSFFFFFLFLFLSYTLSVAKFLFLPAYSFLDPTLKGPKLAAYIVGIAVIEVIVFCLIKMIETWRERWAVRRGLVLDSEVDIGLVDDKDWQEVERPSNVNGMA